MEETGDIPPSIEAETRRQQIALLFDNAPTAILANALNASLLAYVNYTLGIPAAFTGSWAVLVLAIAIVRFLQVRKYAAVSPDISTSDHWLRQFHLGTVAVAAAWGAGTLLFMWHAPQPVYLFTGLVVSGTVAGGLAMLGPVFSVYRAFALLMLLPMAAVILLQSTTTLDVVFGAMTLFLLALVLRGASSMHQTVAASIQLKLEQQALVGGVERARDEANAALTALQQKSDALAESEERYRLILEHSPTGIIHYNDALVITYCNQRFAEIIGAPAERLVGLDMKALDDQRVLAALRQSLQGVTSSYEGEYVATFSHRRIWVSMSCSPLLGPHRADEGGIAIVEDTTERRRAETDLLRLATTDPLTGIPNRRRFMEELELELARTRRFETPAALLMFDIDHFKAVNDTFGHASGDLVLQHFAALVRERMRRTDHFGRMGGEEFAMVLVGTDGAAALQFAERLCHTVADTPARTQKGPIAFSVSIGVTTFTADDDTTDGALARADAALYRAKANGRNRVEAG